MMGIPTVSSRHTTTKSTWTSWVQQRWKGKERAIDVDLDSVEEGTGGEDGVVVSLTLVGDGLYNA